MVWNRLAYRAAVVPRRLVRRLLTPTVPVVSIRPFVRTREHSDADRAASARQWDRAMSDVGFAFLVGHGIDSETVRSLREGCSAYFRRDAAYKESYRHAAYGSPLGGYEGFGEQAVGRSNEFGNGGLSAVQAVPDPVESYVCSRGDPAEWGATLPQQPAEFRAAAAAYYGHMRRVLDGLNLMTAAALGLPSRYFDPLFSPAPQCFVVAKHYPAPDGGSDGGVRYGAHTDYGGYTVLKPDDADGSAPGAGGLEVLLKDRSAWLPVRAPREDAFVVNIGDLYEDMTNGRWTSTVHRVRKPSAGAAAASRGRLSIAFFSGPHDDALCDTLPSCVPVDGSERRMREPITAGAHLRKKIEATRVPTRLSPKGDDDLYKYSAAAK